MPASVAAQSTRAERTAYRETSSYADVVAFLDSLRCRGAGIRLDTLGVSAEGRAIPLVIASRPLVSDPAAARSSGKPVIYLQANIHAGEVEGKEAALMLLRDLTLGPRSRRCSTASSFWSFPSTTPTATSASRPARTNRPGQNGPAMVGRRANGQGLDLNRDYVKMEAPETRGRRDLAAQRGIPTSSWTSTPPTAATTATLLTYSPGLNPNETPASHLRPRPVPARRCASGWPAVTRSATFSYGNFRNQTRIRWRRAGRPTMPGPASAPTGSGCEAGCRSSARRTATRLRIRVSVTYDFVRELLSLAAEERTAIGAVTRDSDRLRPDSVTVRSALGPPTLQDVIAEITEPVGRGDRDVR